MPCCLLPPRRRPHLIALLSSLHNPLLCTCTHDHYSPRSDRDSRKIPSSPSSFGWAVDHGWLSESSFVLWTNESTFPWGNCGLLIPVSPAASNNVSRSEHLRTCSWRFSIAADVDCYGPVCSWDDESALIMAKREGEGLSWWAWLTWSFGASKTRLLDLWNGVDSFLVVVKLWSFFFIAIFSRWRDGTDEFLALTWIELCGWWVGWRRAEHFQHWKLPSQNLRPKRLCVWYIVVERIRWDNVDGLRIQCRPYTFFVF